MFTCAAERPAFAAAIADLCYAHGARGGVTSSSAVVLTLAATVARVFALHDSGLVVTRQTRSPILTVAATSAIAAVARMGAAAGQ